MQRQCRGRSIAAVRAVWPGQQSARRGQVEGVRSAGVEHLGLDRRVGRHGVRDTGPAGIGGPGKQSEPVADEVVLTIKEFPT
jgi:hypothetical protein